MTIANILSIAGSDPSGGAGIQADIKTFSALGTYGMAAITALTAQNTRGVSRVQLPPAEFVGAQIDAIFADIRVDAVKIGMVATAENVDVIADSLMRHDVRNLVVDPVMVAKGGHPLLTPAAISAVRERLIPRALVVTPNLPEAAALLDVPEPRTVAEMQVVARALHELGPRFVYLKGGHLDLDVSPDLIFDGTQAVELNAARISTMNTHGTGCTLSAAIAALLPQCCDVIDAMRRAKAYVMGAISGSGALAVGRGHGPVHHFQEFWTSTGSRLSITEPAEV